MCAHDKLIESITAKLISVFQIITQCQDFLLDNVLTLNNKKHILKQYNNVGISVYKLMADWPELNFCQIYRHLELLLKYIVT